MLLSRRVPLPSLIEFSRALRHNLSAGLTLRRVLRQQAERGPMAIRPVAERISEQLEQGESFEQALKGEKAAFPPLFISLATVGEQSGGLPEVLTELEKFYVLQQRLQREFARQIAWPLIQFLIAPFVIAGMIFILGILSPAGGGYDPLRLGYVGAAGAFKFLLHYFGAFALLIGAYYLITRTLKQREFVDTLLLRMWVIGPTMQAIAMTRFCVSLYLTTESGMPIANALRLSMRGTGNTAFTAREDQMRESIRNGEDLALALRKTGVFPEDFLNIVESAEEGGRVSEIMRHQTEFYEEETRRRLTILTTTASWTVYALVACLIIFMIFRIFTSYISLLDSIH
jgi:type II secretory pathway component PulF